MTASVGVLDDAAYTPLAQRVFALSTEAWGSHHATPLIGRHHCMLSVQEQLLQFAQARSPVLITGETGTGKELFARALYLLSRLRGKPYLSVNCAQYHDGQLLASELFGHRRGAFTGAVSDHRGMFECAHGGAIFLDEIGELSLPAQAMLLRALSEGEIMPVGATRAVPVNVWTIAATSRDLRAMIARGTFREDLYYRLRFLQLRVPALRERGDDWELLARYYVDRLSREEGNPKRFSNASLTAMSEYDWPGNVRELRSIVDTGYYRSDGQIIEAEVVTPELGRMMRLADMPIATDAAMKLPIATMHDLPAGSGSSLVDTAFHRMTIGGESFWSVVYEPFMERDMSRADARAIMRRGLRESFGSYKRLVELFNVDQEAYLKFMDFLRHHRLKPER
jgi:DNA-binding NtrC family response regulator